MISNFHSYVISLLAESKIKPLVCGGSSQSFPHAGEGRGMFSLALH